MKWWFYLVPGLMAHLKKCAENEGNLYKELKRERACVDFYAHITTWGFMNNNTYKGVYVISHDTEWCGEIQMYSGGKMARETVKARK